MEMIDCGLVVLKYVGIVFGQVGTHQHSLLRGRNEICFIIILYEVDISKDIFDKEIPC